MNPFRLNQPNCPVLGVITSNYLEYFQFFVEYLNCFFSVPSSTATKRFTTWHSIIPGSFWSISCFVIVIAFIVDTFAVAFLAVVAHISPAPAVAAGFTFGTAEQHSEEPLSLLAGLLGGWNRFFSIELANFVVVNVINLMNYN